MSSDPHLRQVYDRLHQTPMQEKFRRIAPMPIGVVFIERPGMTEADWRRQLKLMKKLGFTCLKGIHLCPGSDLRKFQHAALDEGLIPWWYDDGGWEAITDQLLDKLGIDRSKSAAEIRNDPKMRAYQMQVLRDRVDARHDNPPLFAHGRKRDKSVFSFDYQLHDAAVPQFVVWLQQQYATPEAVYRAWNMDHSMVSKMAEPWESWQALAAELPDLIGTREYRRIRDVMRFKADWYLDHLRQRIREHQAVDAHEPMRAGGEMGLFLPFAARSTDMEGIAELMAGAGSFYPSIHLAWHFEETFYEAARSVYMQASLVSDWFKGGWVGPWESTGGPQQLSGGKGLFEGAAEHTPGFTVDAGVMTQLMLSYLAAGMRGFGFWCWNARTAGWEAGEFALLDRNDEVCDRTIQVGRIGQAAQRYRDELWAARKEPLVGVYCDFDNEAMWASVSANGRDKFRHTAVQARIGVSRALVNGNVPFEYITASDIRNDLAGRYRTIYLPCVIALDSGVLAKLTAFVEQGGRLVVDMPSAWLDEYGRLLRTGEGTPFETLFGAKIQDFQFSRNVQWTLDGQDLHGFVLELAPTRAEVVRRFGNGRPAVTVNAFGKGQAVMLAFELSLACWREGNAWGEQMIVEQALGDDRVPFTCEGVLAYRQVGEAADHYFLVNPGPEVRTQLKTGDLQYTAALDAITQEPLDLAEPLTVPANSGRWLRLQKVH